MKISAIYRKIFPQTAYFDFEDWSFKTSLALFSLIVGLILIVTTLTFSLHEHKNQVIKLKSDVEVINARIETSEKKLDAINKRLDALEKVKK